MRRTIPCSVLLSALFAASPIVAAQDAAPVAAAAAAERTFVPADFARYSPRNALEMLEQVPGFVIRAAVQERGLGQATGNVLVNGQRLSGKSNDVLAQLARVPAANVVRIEIRDGATLAVTGLSGEVANIVTASEGISGTWRWRPDVRKYFTDPQLLRGDVSVAGGHGGIDWTLGLEVGANHSGAGGYTRILEADGSLREERRDAWTGEYVPPRLTAGFTRNAADGDISHVDLSLQYIDYDYVEDGTRSGPGLPDRERRVRSTEGGYSHELNADHEFAWGPGRLKLIGLLRQARSPISDEVEVDYADGSPTSGSRFVRDGEAVERIARGEYRWKRGVSDWQISGEYAFNRLDSAAALLLRDAGGTYVPDPDFGGREIVQEDRYEVMGSWGRPIGPRTTLQLSAGAEHSRIEAGGSRRAFVRPKGTLLLAFAPRAGLALNLQLQRRIGQLDFYDFLASVDLNDEQANAGNPELVPPQTSELSIEAVRDLGRWGNTSLRAYAQRIDDIVDTVPIGTDGESPGNLDQGTRWGLEWKASFVLEPIGWTGAKLDLRAVHQRSQVEDPLTGESRPISNDLEDLAELSLRHDVPDTSWAWGGDISYAFSAQDYRLGEVGRFWEGPLWAGLYVERKEWHRMTWRLSASNLLDARSRFDRTVYVDRRTGPVDYVQHTDRLIGPIYSLTVSGKF